MKNKWFKTFLIITTIEAILASLWLLLIPSDISKGSSFQLSPQRIALLFPLVVSAIVLIVIAVRNKNNDFKIEIEKHKSFSKIINAIRITLFVLNIILFLIIVLSPIALNSENEVYLFSTENPFIPRMLPLITFFLVTGIQLNIVILRTKKQNSNLLRELISLPTLFIGAIVIIVVFVCSMIFGWGVNVYDGWIADWGIPLLEWQVLAVFITLLHSYLFAIANPSKKNNIISQNKKEIAIFILIWLLAFSIWMFTNFDYDGSYFNTNPTPPTYELFPHSDARQYYSASVEFITGDGIDNSFARQYYVLFIAICNILFNYNISNIITLQILILSLTPALLYLLSTRLKEQFAGIFLSMIVIIRETNAIRNAGALNTTPVHLLMSDMVCLFLIILNLYFAIRWIQSQHQVNRNRFSLITGALLGINIALRIYVILFVPVLIILLFFYQKDRKMFWREIFFYGLGLATAILPVLIRNYIATGVITLERPIFWDHFMNFSSMDNKTSTAEIAPSLGGIILNLLSNIGPLFTKTMNHFSNDLFSNWMTFFATSHAQHEGTYFYYLIPDMRTRWNNFESWRILIAFLIALLSILGLARSIKRNKKTTILLLSFYLTYAFGMAWVGASGWRFILPVDWIGLFFVILGLIQALEYIFKKQVQEKKEVRSSEKKNSPKRTYGIFVIFLFIASIYFIRDTFFSKPYLGLASSEVCTQISNVSSEFCELKQNKDLLFQKGILLYPNYYPHGTYFQQAKSYDLFVEQTFDRYTFTYIGDDPKHVYFPSDDPTYELKNGMEVILGLKQTQTGWQAIYIYDTTDQKLYPSVPME